MNCFLSRRAVFGTPLFHHGRSATALSSSHSSMHRLSCAGGRTGWVWVLLEQRRCASSSSSGTQWSFFDEADPHPPAAQPPSKKVSPTERDSTPTRGPVAPASPRPPISRVTPPPPPPPPASSSSGGSSPHNNSLPSARGYRTPPEVLDALVPFIPTFWVPLPAVLERLPPEMRELITISNTVPPPQFLRKYRFYFDLRVAHGHAEVRLRPDVHHPRRGTADASFSSGMSSSDIHEQTIGAGAASRMALGAVPHTESAFTASASPSSGLLGSRQPPRNSEESLLLALVTKCPGEWQVLAEFLRLATPIMQKHPAYDARLGVLGFLERHNTYFQIVDGKIRVRPFSTAPYSLDMWDVESSAHPAIISKVLEALPSADRPAANAASASGGGGNLSVDTQKLQALLTEDERQAVRATCKSFARFLRMHGKLLVVSTDNCHARRFVPDDEPCADHVAARRLEADHLNPNDPVLRIPATMNDAAMKDVDATYRVRELYDALPLVQAVVLQDLLVLVPNHVRQGLPASQADIKALMLRYPEYFSCWDYPDDPSQLVVQRAKLVTPDVPREDLVRAVLPLIPQGGLDAEKLLRRVPLPVQRHFYKHGLETTLKEQLAEFVLVVNHKVMKTC